MKSGQMLLSDELSQIALVGDTLNQLLKKQAAMVHSSISLNAKVKRTYPKTA